MNVKTIKKLVKRVKDSGTPVSIDCDTAALAEKLWKEIYESKASGFDTRIVIGHSWVHIIPAPKVGTINALQLKDVE